jgi:hypothetical protein
MTLSKTHQSPFRSSNKLGGNVLDKRLLLRSIPLQRNTQQPLRIKDPRLY